MKTRLTILILCILLLFVGCEKKEPALDTIPDTSGNQENNPGNESNPGTSGNPDAGEQGESADLGDDNKSFGESLDALGAYDGYFEEASQNITIECLSGSDQAYSLSGNKLTFTN